jgi:uncharacterized protein (DUF362 family)
LNSSARRVALFDAGSEPSAAIRDALTWCGILERISITTRVAIKPNLTFPFPKAGVTTSPAVIRETVKLLRQLTSHLAIVESDGGYGAWSADEAFRGHGLHDLGTEFGIEVANLCDEPREPIEFRTRRGLRTVPLPTRLLHETDVFITMPVPKIHCMTGVSLAFKNQWGCVPDKMRLRSHYVFDEAIVAINRALKPAVLADGTCFLDGNGPMEGTAVPMNVIIAATDPGSFDRYTSELMGVSWRRIGHLRRAAQAGDMPRELGEVSFNVEPARARQRRFRLRRTPRNWIALMGFRSRFVTWFGYESWFGRVVLHAILYAIVGKPVKPQRQGS